MKIRRRFSCLSEIGGLANFVQGLKDTGFIEGNNISIEWRWAEGQYDRLPSLAGELVSGGVAVIVALALQL